MPRAKTLTAAEAIGRIMDPPRAMSYLSVHGQAAIRLMHCQSKISLDHLSKVNLRAASTQASPGIVPIALAACASSVLTAGFLEPDVSRPSPLSSAGARRAAKECWIARDRPMACVIGERPNRNQVLDHRLWNPEA
jgi:hypothetical protein